MWPPFHIVPQLQANFAFTKAYVAEQTGGKGKLPGPAFYVDMAIFGKERPQWIDLGPDIDWAHPKFNLHAVFAEVRGIKIGNIRAAARRIFATALPLRRRLPTIQMS